LASTILEYEQITTTEIRNIEHCTTTVSDELKLFPCKITIRLPRKLGYRTATTQSTRLVRPGHGDPTTEV